MSKHNDEVIRDLAYALWVEAGSPDGEDQKFWHDAERQLAEGSDLDTSEDASKVTKIPLIPGLPNL